MNSAKYLYTKGSKWFYCDESVHYEQHRKLADGIELFIDAARCSNTENKSSSAKQSFSTGNSLTITQEVAIAKVI